LGQEDTVKSSFLTKQGTVTKNTRSILLHQYGYRLEWRFSRLIQSSHAVDRKSRLTDRGHFRSYL